MHTLYNMYMHMYMYVHDMHMSCLMCSLNQMLAPRPAKPHETVAVR